jgi:hypothetical protein
MAGNSAPPPEVNDMLVAELLMPDASVVEALFENNWTVIDLHGIRDVSRK